MLYTIVGILLVLWLLGFSMNVGGGLIHALLVIAAVVFLFNLISGRRAALCQPGCLGRRGIVHETRTRGLSQP